jgi:LysM repeat protein
MAKYLSIRQRKAGGIRSILPFLYYLPIYLKRRTELLLLYFLSSIEVIWSFGEHIKSSIVSRLFWGRGNLYRSTFHYIVVIFTCIGLIVSLSSRFLIQAGNPLNDSNGLSATVDLMQQGASIQSVLEADPLTPEVPIEHHIVASNETLSEIAAKYGVSKDTIHWANLDIMSPFSDDIQVGWELKIPSIDGLLYTVTAGDTLESVTSRFSSNMVYREDIIELNSLVPPSYVLTAGDLLFIPNGLMDMSLIQVEGVPKGVFKSPVSNPDCVGYVISRGYTSYHHGVDLARYPGCPLRAIAAGTVIFAGWSPLAGYNVKIDHGGGIKSHYYHGAPGGLWVKDRR